MRHECSIESKHTTVDLLMCCRQVCYEILEQDGGMLGGEGHVVEVDEAKFGRRKYHRGKRVDGIWVFGMVERGSNSGELSYNGHNIQGSKRCLCQTFLRSGPSGASSLRRLLLYPFHFRRA
jgi:hypothetical protein